MFHQRNVTKLLVVAILLLLPGCDGGMSGIRSFLGFAMSAALLASGAAVVLINIIVSFFKQYYA